MLQKIVGNDPALGCRVTYFKAIEPFEVDGIWYYPPLRAPKMFTLKEQDAIPFFIEIRHMLEDQR